MSPGQPPRELRVVPRLVFEVRRTVAAATTAGMGPAAANTELTIVPEAGMELLGELGPEVFATLMALAMCATETADGHLQVERPNPLITEVTGWSRNKVAKQLQVLEDAGFIHRPPRNFVVGKEGRRVYGATTLVLASALYSRVERRVTVTDRVTHSPASAHVTATALKRSGGETATAPMPSTGDPATAPIRSTGGAPTAPEQSSGPGASASPRSTSSPSAAQRGTGSDVAGRGSAASRSSAVAQHPHGDEDDDELHSSTVDEHEEPAALHLTGTDGSLRLSPAPTRHIPDDLDRLRPLASLTRPHDGVPAALAVLNGQVSEFTVDEVREMPDEQTVALLKSWQVFAADKLVRETPRHLVTEAIEATTSRLGEVANPGAYFRSLLREAARGGRPAPRPAAARDESAAREAARSEVTPPADAPSKSDGPDLSQWVPAALEQLDAAVVDELEAHARHAVACHPGRGLASIARIVRLEALAEELRARGISPT